MVILKAEFGNIQSCAFCFVYISYLGQMIHCLIRYIHKDTAMVLHVYYFSGYI